MVKQMLVKFYHKYWYGHAGLLRGFLLGSKLSYAIWWVANTVKLPYVYLAFTRLHMLLWGNYGSCMVQGPNCQWYSPYSYECPGCHE